MKKESGRRREKGRVTGVGWGAARAGRARGLPSDQVRRVACWLAHMYGVEQTGVEYPDGWPPPPIDWEERDRLLALENAAVAIAFDGVPERDAQVRVWADAMAAWDAEEKPA